MALEPGTRLGPYEIVELRGKGGMGEVYEARDTRLGRSVAVKVLPESLSQNQLYRERLEREAKTISQLQHPHICTLHDVGSAAEAPFYLVMEYLEGETLRARLKKGALPLPEVLRIGREIAEAMEAAHRQGVVHRDLKPSNVMLTAAGTKVLDFGLAKGQEDRSVASDTHAATLIQPLTAEGSIVGTMPYMAPEQLEGAKADSRTDIWALGCILYIMTTGERPFHGDTQASLISSIMGSEPEPMSTSQALTPPRLDEVVRRCLEKDPDRRWQSSADLSIELDSIQMQGPETASAERWRWLAAAAAIVLLGSVVWWFSRGEAPADTLTAVEEAAPWPILVIRSFEDTENDPQFDYFSQGATDTLVRRLAGLQGVYVVPASSGVFSPFVLQGSVRRSAESVRMRFDLLRHDLFNREPDRSLGGSVVEGKPEALFTLQDGAGEQIAALLSAELGSRIDFVARRMPTRDSLAYDLYLRGRHALRQSDDEEAVDRAIDDFRRSLSQDPDFALARGWMGEAYLSKEQLTEQSEWLGRARSACETAAGAEPELAVARLCLSRVHRRLGNDVAAAETLLQAIELDATPDEVYAELASLYRATSKSDEGVEAFRRATLINPSHWLAWAYLGYFHSYNTLYDEAVFDFEQSVRMSPGYARGYGSLGAIYCLAGRLGEAIDVLEKAMEIQPGLPGARENLGNAYFWMGKYDGAIQVYEGVVETSDATYRSYGNLAKAYYWSEERAAARDWYERAIEIGEERLSLEPQDAEAHIMLANYFAMIGDTEKTHRHLEDALSLSDHAEFLFQAALIYTQLKDANRALDFLERAAEKGYSRAELRFTPELEDLRADPRFGVLLRGG